MSNLTQISEQLEQLPRNERQAIIALIDLKTEDDMDKVLTRLDAMETKFDAKFNALSSQMSHLQWFMAAIIGILALLIKFPNLIP